MPFFYAEGTISENQWQSGTQNRVCRESFEFCRRFWALDPFSRRKATFREYV